MCSTDKNKENTLLSLSSETLCFLIMSTKIVSQNFYFQCKLVQYCNSVDINYGQNERLCESD